MLRTISIQFEIKGEYSDSKEETLFVKRMNFRKRAFREVDVRNFDWDGCDGVGSDHYTVNSALELNKLKEFATNRGWAVTTV